MKAINITLLLLLYFSSFSINAQNNNYGVGEWEYHFNFNRGQLVASAAERTYCTTGTALFYYDKKENNISKFTKADGLSDIEISAMKYNKQTNQVIIGYANGNIDIIKDREITNINDIAQASISGSKRINNITFHGDFAYLSTGFSVVQVDLKKVRINNAYRFIGEGGSQITALNTAFANDSIYVNTPEGLLSASQTSTNLQDFNNWKLNSTYSNIENIASLDDSLYVQLGEEAIYKYQHGALTKLEMPGEGGIYFLKEDNGRLLYGIRDSLVSIKNSVEYEAFTGNYIGNFNDGVIDDDGRIWIADWVYGLVFSQPNGSFHFTFPNGPRTNDAYGLYSFGYKTYVTTGGLNSSYTPRRWERGVYEYSNLRWTSHLNGLPLPDDWRDPIAVQYNDFTDKLYISSYYRGVLEWDRKNDSMKVYNDTNSPIHKAADVFVKVMGMDVDNQGNLWICNHESQGNPSIHKLSPDGEFDSYHLGSANSEFPNDIIVDNFNTKWIRIGNTNALKGLYAFDSETNQSRRLRTDAGNGGLPNSQVNDIAKDRNGHIWVATERGVAVYNEPQNVFSSQMYDARLPIVEGRPLMQDEIVTCIAVDGANRKWFGTDNGIFLFGPNGETPIHHFTRENSPLPSNDIQDISVHESTGEVMIATNLGVVSYWGDSSKGKEKHESVKIFPNPVEPDFTGNVGITGLAEDVVVKITDISGKLIYQQDANGGMASWNVKNIDGRRARTGIYMVFSSNNDGSETFVGKIAVIE